MKKYVFLQLSDQLLSCYACCEYVALHEFLSRPQRIYDYAKEHTVFLCDMAQDMHEPIVPQEVGLICQQPCSHVHLLLGPLPLALAVHALCSCCAMRSMMRHGHERQARLDHDSHAAHYSASSCFTACI